VRVDPLIYPAASRLKRIGSRRRFKPASLLDHLAVAATAASQRDFGALRAGRRLGPNRYWLLTTARVYGTYNFGAWRGEASNNAFGVHRYIFLYYLIIFTNIYIYSLCQNVQILRCTVYMFAMLIWYVLLNNFCNIY